MMRFCLILMLGFQLGNVSFAGPQLEAIIPAAATTQQEFTVLLQGRDLEKPLDLLLYRPGLECVKLQSTDDGVQATLRAAKDCPLGEHPIRLVTEQGASTLRVLHMLANRLTPESSEAHGRIDQAQKVPVNSTILGVLESDEVDVYAVEVKEKMRLSVELVAVRLGSPNIDPRFIIRDPQGQIIVEVDDTPLSRQDPMASIEARSTGLYTIEVRDAAEGGSDTDQYLLHVGHFPRPMAVYPAGAQIGSKPVCTFLGDGSGDFTQELPANGETQPVHARDALGQSPTAFPFRWSKFANILETEPNQNITDLKDRKDTIPGWPIAFNGILNQAQDQDVFPFRVRQGDQFDIRVYGTQLGSAIDSSIVLMNAAGDTLALSDDDDTHDSWIRYTSPQDQILYLQIRDKRGQGDAHMVYRVEIDEPRPGLEVFLPTAERKSQDQHVVAVPQGGRVGLFFAVKRTDVKGPVTLSFPDLPEGLSFQGPMVVRGEEYLIPVVLEASASTEIKSHLINIQAQSGKVLGGFTQHVRLIRGPGDSSLNTVELDRLCISVVPTQPYSVNILAPKAALPQDGIISLAVQVRRDAAFAGPLEVSFPVLPDGVEAPATIVIPTDQTEATVELIASKDAEIGDFPIFATVKPAGFTAMRIDPGMPMGMPSGVRRPRQPQQPTHPVSSPICTLSLAKPILTGELIAVAAEQGQTVKMRCRIERSEALKDLELEGKLLTLPPRVTSVNVTIPASQDVFEFPVVIDPTSPLGEHSSHWCEIQTKINGQSVTFRIGRASRLVIFPKDGMRTDDKGQPLSPLDALRQKSKGPPKK